MNSAQNDRLLRALHRQPVDCTPVWIMRQAGRYLPEYRATREKAGDFLTLCKTPELACEVTLQPLRRFPLDAAILFSDILTVPDAMGLGLAIIESVGPTFEKPVRTLADIENLPMPDPEVELKYVMDATRLIRRELAGRVPLIGFSGSPWTLATYMIEGRPSKDFSLAKGMMYNDPHALHKLLAHISTAVVAYLNGQIQAGAQALMLFDTWGGVLTRDAYLEFSLAYMTRIINALDSTSGQQPVPVILYSKGAGQWCRQMADSGCAAIGLDWTVDIDVVRASVGDKVALQGNLDPAVLYGTTETIRKEVDALLQRFGPRPGHVFNLGHGVQPGIDPDRVGELVTAVHELSRPLHQV